MNPPSPRRVRARINRRLTKDRIALLKALPYDDYLKSEWWAFAKTRALRKVKYRCQLCNQADQPLHVHHRSYLNLGNERSHDLTVLCQPCHQLFHSVIPVPKS